MRVLRNLVSEETSVKQVLVKVQLGEADAGIVYASDVSEKVLQDVNAVAIPSAYNRLASYPMSRQPGQRAIPQERWPSFVSSSLHRGKPS